jgi:ferritin-like metal-binding protein YciE
MAIQTAEDFFIQLLSNLRASESRLVQLTDDLSRQAQDSDVKNMLSVRSYLTQQDVNNIEKCFQILGRQPVPPTTKFFETWAEDAKREYDAIQMPGLKVLYALMKVRTMQDFHIGEYRAATAMAAYAGNIAITTLLEHSLADKMEFVERTRELVRARVEQLLAGAARGKAA